MGMEVRYHALPEDWHILTEVCHEARFAEYLQFLDYYLNDPEFRLDSVLTDSKEDLEETAFVVAVQSLKVARPGIEQRYFYEGTRSWDVLSYLLSGVYKASDVDFEYVWEVIEQLRHFYAQTVDAGEGTLVAIN